MAAPYYRHVLIIPGIKPRSEAGVLIAQRWILAVLRHCTFYSLAEINTATRECLERLNSHLLRHAKKTRRELFETLDCPSALPLPPSPYEYAEWIKAKVNFDYYIEVEDHYYSVPFQLLHERLDIRQDGHKTKNNPENPGNFKTINRQWKCIVW